MGQAKKPVEEVERVAIRFCWRLRRRHAADGHQVHRIHGARRQRPLHLPRLPGRDPRPGRLARRRLRLPDPLRGATTSARPADQPDVLVAFNPAALRANVEDLRPNGMLIVNSDAFVGEEPRARGLREDDPLPALRDRFRVVEVPITSLNREALQRHEARRARGRSLQELLRARPRVLALRPADRVDAALARRRASRATCCEANLRVLKAGYPLRRDHGAVPRLVHGAEGEDPAGRLPQHHRQHGARLGHRRGGRADRAAGLPRRLPDHARERRAARARALPALRREDLPGRGRDRRGVSARSARPSPATSPSAPRAGPASC